MSIRFVDGLRDNMPWDRKFIKERFPISHGIFFVFISVVNLVAMLWRSAVHCLHLTYPKLDVGFENRPHTEDRLPQKFSLLSLCKLDIPTICTKQQLLKKRKIGYLLYCASMEQKSAGFLANHFCKWLPAEPGRRLSAPSHCTGFTCSKRATLALKPFGAKLLGCDCRGLNCYHSIRILLWLRNAY